MAKRSLRQKAKELLVCLAVILALGLPLVIEMRRYGYLASLKDGYYEAFVLTDAVLWLVLGVLVLSLTASRERSPDPAVLNALYQPAADGSLLTSDSTSRTSRNILVWLAVILSLPFFIIAFIILLVINYFLPFINFGNFSVLSFESVMNFLLAGLLTLLFVASTLSRIKKNSKANDQIKIFPDHFLILPQNEKVSFVEAEQISIQYSYGTRGNSNSRVWLVIKCNGKSKIFTFFHDPSIFRVDLERYDKVDSMDLLFTHLGFRKIKTDLPMPNLKQIGGPGYDMAIDYVFNHGQLDSGAEGN